MNRAQHSVFRQRVNPAFFALLFLSGAGALIHAQAPNPTSAGNPFFGSVTVRGVSDEALKLSLDEAVRRGLENNLGLKEAENGEKTIQGEKNEALQEFLPTITAGGDLGVYQHNLVALGFSPGVIKEFAPLFPGGVVPPGLSEITRDDLTEGQIHYSQMLFSGPVIAAWKAAGAAQKAAYFDKMNARSEVVQQVAAAYLRAIAAASEVDNARALMATAEVLLDHAHAAHQAGTVSNLDELRARVQLQAQQQALIEAENSLEKDLILLQRETGIDPGQKIVLTDPAPYSELAAQTPEEVRAIAYQNRQDYQYSAESGAGVQGHPHRLSQPAAAQLELRRLLRRQQGQRGRLARKLRGPGHPERAALPRSQVARRCASRPGPAIRRGCPTRRPARQIDQQVRSALLDVDATAKLVQVARSNVDLATRALSDETDRVNAGVDDNLPLVTAQATLASAQSNLVESLYQYNLAKLALARAAGVLEQQYRVYLGR